MQLCAVRSATDLAWAMSHLCPNACERYSADGHGWNGISASAILCQDDWASFALAIPAQVAQTRPRSGARCSSRPKAQFASGPSTTRIPLWNACRTRVCAWMITTVTGWRGSVLLFCLTSAQVSAGKAFGYPSERSRRSSIGRAAVL